MRGSVPLPPVPAGRRLWQRRILKKGSCRGIWHALGCRLAGQLGWLGWAGLGWARLLVLESLCAVCRPQRAQLLGSLGAHNHRLGVVAADRAKVGGMKARGRRSAIAGQKCRLDWHIPCLPLASSHQKGCCPHPGPRPPQRPSPTHLMLPPSLLSFSSSPLIQV